VLVACPKMTTKLTCDETSAGLDPRSPANQTNWSGHLSTTVIELAKISVERAVLNVLCNPRVGQNFAREWTNYVCPLRLFAREARDRQLNNTYQSYCGFWTVGYWIFPVAQLTRKGMKSLGFSRIVSASRFVRGKMRRPTTFRFLVVSL